MSQNQDLEQIELTIEQCKDKIDKAKSLAILNENIHFKKLILEGFLKDQAIKMVQNKASFGMMDANQQKFIEDQIIAIGQFGQYLRFIKQEGYLAEDALASNESERELIIAEGDI